MDKPFKVLIVEDDDDARSNMVDILSLDGYQIETASHCLPAINLIESNRFGAVIVDWKLPDGNGGDLFPIIFQSQPNTPVIVVTGMRDFDVAVTALREGVYDFLLKPINPDALRAVLHRVVERSEHLQKLEEAQSKLVQNERLAAIGQMVAGLAHESRNAFQRSHACLANLALDVREMPESLDLVHKIQQALDHLNALLEEVRDYSAPIILERSPTNLESLIRETWMQIALAHSCEDSIEFRVESDEAFPNEIKLDRRRISQVFWNLLENARVAVSEAERPGEITIRLWADSTNGNCYVGVRDNGCGITAEQGASVFEPFFTTKTKGTGLGLAICRRILESHGGGISVSNEEPHGTEFKVWLSSSEDSQSPK